MALFTVGGEKPTHTLNGKVCWSSVDPALVLSGACSHLLHLAVCIREAAEGLLPSIHVSFPIAFTTPIQE
jgi:hypothetical protein